MFPFAPPDRSLATKQMSGKKTKKFRITVGFACNTDGSEKVPIFFIGKSKQPRCFKRITSKAHGFYYQNNKSAWMTLKFFEEWIIAFDVRMRNENRHIVLFIDNFSGHNISYKPCNIELEYFEPNLTPFVQPLDAGIIPEFNHHPIMTLQYCPLWQPFHLHPAVMFELILAPGASYVSLLNLTA